MELCFTQKPKRILSTTSLMSFKFLKKQQKKGWSVENIFVLELGVREPGFQLQLYYVGVQAISQSLNLSGCQFSHL